MSFVCSLLMASATFATDQVKCEPDLKVILGAFNQNELNKNVLDKSRVKSNASLYQQGYAGHEFLVQKERSQFEIDSDLQMKKCIEDKTKQRKKEKKNSVPVSDDVLAEIEESCSSIIDKKAAELTVSHDKKLFALYKEYNYAHHLDHEQLSSMTTYKLKNQAVNMYQDKDGKVFLVERVKFDPTKGEMVTEDLELNADCSLKLKATTYPNADYVTFDPKACAVEPIFRGGYTALMNAKSMQEADGIRMSLLNVLPQAGVDPTNAINLFGEYGKADRSPMSNDFLKEEKQTVEDYFANCETYKSIIKVEAQSQGQAVPATGGKPSTSK